MNDRWAFEWINKNAEVGPLFRIGRDVYERDRAGQRVIRLKAVESYPAEVADAAVTAFAEMARIWKAPVLFIIDPNLKKPPAVRFLFEWSRKTHAMGAVDRAFMKTGNLVSQVMGKVVLRVFTDGALPFEAIQGEAAVQKRLGELDLSCNREGFRLVEPSTALVRAEDAPPSLLGSIFRRAARRISGRR